MKFFFSFLIFTLSITAYTQQEKYHSIKIYGDDAILQSLQQKGLTIDHGDYIKGISFQSDFSESDLQILKENNTDYEIIIEDVQAYYIERNNQNFSREESSRTSKCFPSTTTNIDTPENFELGSMGGFFTYNEFLAHLDTMYSKFPNLITQRDTVDTITSHEGRPIFWLKISDNPTVDETEPEILYTALHHAREPASLSQTIMYMYYLLENYGTNDEVTYLVDNTAMYFIPMVNPDGYIYNESTNPNGGGQWRKNRRNNQDGTMGVDLNRNYGHKWGYDNNGSSPNTSRDTYRGTQAFSEPETKATKLLVENHNFIACLNYHTFGNLLIYPWGYEASIYTPDSVKFVEFAKILTEDNNYNYGTGDQTVGYVTNGDSDDWMYGAENVLSFTPEAGESGDGFWPAANRIETISKENIRQNLNLAWLVNKYAYAEDLSVQSFTDLSIKIPVKTKRLGYDNTGSYEVTLTPIDGYSTVTNGPFTYNNLNHLESKIDSFLVSLNTTIAEGQHFQFELTVNNGTQTNIDTITKLFGEEKSVFSSNGSTLNDFDSDNNWAITTNEFYSAPSCITESVGSEYANNTNNSIIISRDINLTAAAQATVSFMSKWALEPGYDYVQLLASNDNGITWNALCGNYTSAGTEYQDEGKPLYDGYQLDWIEENINLNDYLGEIIRLKFQIVSDAFTTADGFYFDDLKVKIIGDLVSVNTEISDEPHLEIYPNPNNGNFSTNTTGTIIIKNMLGQEISFTHINKGKIINVSRLTKGVYFVTIGNETEKIIVQ